MLSTDQAGAVHPPSRAIGGGRLAVEKGSVGRASLRAIVAMGALAVIEVEVAIQVVLQLVDGGIEVSSQNDREALFFDGSTEEFVEAVCLR
jgi:hypothetical protein